MRFLSRIPVLVWFLLPTIIILVVGVFAVTKLTTAPKTDETKPEPVSKAVEGTQDYPIVSREHITEGVNGSGYNSNPPSSGPHWATPADKGVSDNPIADERAIHNLEHGYIWITYKKEIGDDLINKLKDLVNGDSYKTIMSPREGNEAKIALVAWGRVLNMNTLDTDKVKDFIKTYRNRGPEKTTEQ